MDETDFRILHTLSRDPGKQLSIRGLTAAIRSLHGTAHYANTYRAARRLQKEDILCFTKAGNSQLVSLNLGSPLAINSLAEMELLKRRLLFERLKTLRGLLESIPDVGPFGPVALIDPERNAKLNRAEILLCLPHRSSSEGEAEAFRQGLDRIGMKLNLRIDPLALDEEEILSLLAARDINPLKEMLARQTVLLAPDVFWFQMRRCWARGVDLRFDQRETNPAKMREDQVLWNLSRLGYEEFGPRLKGGDEVGIEVLAIALLVRRDPRYAAAAAVILAKNPASYRLLLFLSKKHGVEGELLDVLEAVEKRQPQRSRQEAIRALAVRRPGRAGGDDRHIERTLRTYDAV